MNKKSVLILISLLFITSCITDNDGDSFPPPGDCDDFNPDVNPEAVEKPNDKIDNDCDGNIDEIPSAEIWSDGCNIRYWENTCKARIYWKSSTDAPGGSVLIMRDGERFKCGKAGNQPFSDASGWDTRSSWDYDFITEEGIEFKIFASQDCNNPIGGALDNLVVKGVKESEKNGFGDLWVEPCIGNPTCNSTVSWDWKNIETPYVQVRVDDQYIFTCRPGTLNEVNGLYSGTFSKLAKWGITDSVNFKLYKAYDCDEHSSSLGDLLDEVDVIRESPTPKAEIMGSDCVVPSGEDFCTTRVFWKSQNLDEGIVQINMIDHLGNSYAWACSGSNRDDPYNEDRFLATSKENKWIRKEGTTFKLFPVDDCDQSNPVENVLAEITVKAKDLERPICTITGEPIREDIPEDFVSVDIYTLKEKEPGKYNYLQYEDAVDYISIGNIGKVKQTIQWFDIQPNQGDFDEDKLAHYDAMVDDFTKRGVDVELELHGVPPWASSCDDDEGVNCAKLTGYAPRNIEDWKNYVGFVVDRYKDRVDSWGVWAEPNNKGFLKKDVSDTNEQRADNYLEILNAAYSVIHEVDNIDFNGDGENAVVLASNTNVAGFMIEQHRADPGGDWRINNFLIKVLQEARGNFDAFSIHVLVDEDVETQMNVVRFVRDTLDEYGFENTPLYVTSTQISGIEEYIPGGGIFCPYVDLKPEFIPLWEENQEYITQGICMRESGPGDFMCDPASYIHYSEEDQADILNDMFVCLANEGADTISWYQFSETNFNAWWATSWDFRIGWCPPDGIGRIGILGESVDKYGSLRFVPRQSYYAVKGISEYAKAIND
ncbi:MopE-related protein [Nanoarchaeota archaeon]